MKRLVLWDIDGTLLTTVGVSRHIFAAALRAVTGHELVHMPSMAGKTDCELITTLCHLHDIPIHDGLHDAMYAAMAEAIPQWAPEMRTRGRALPGTHAALEALSTHDVIQTLVTGNIPALARAKLTLFGLERHLDLELGGYGNDSPDRADLVKLARTRTEAKHGHPIHPEHVVVIGDTPHDITGAHANTARAIAVATGTSSLEALQAAGADHVLPSLHDTGALLAAVLG